MLGARRLLALRQFQQATRQLSDHGHGVPDRYKHLQRITMNEGGYPIPDRLYADAYAARQSKYNKLMVIGATFLISSLIFVKTQGTFDFLEPPPREVKNWK